MNGDGALIVRAERVGKDTLLSQIQSKPTYQRLLVAQENFDKIMSRVNDWILEGIEKGATSSIITL